MKIEPRGKPMHSLARVTIRGQRMTLTRPRCRLLPANDGRDIIRASLPDLREREREILSDLACGDTDERRAWRDLGLVRRSILACGGKGVLRVA
jgi:hypothetical protein